MKTEKKQYRLRRWYPSLHPEWKHEEITVEKTKDGNYVNFMDCQVVPKHEVENNPDFWEEVKQPLFVTDDDIEIFDDTTEIISVSIKHHTVSKWGYRYLCKPLDCENFKHFGIEANADKYIEDNKPKTLFITDDGVEVLNEETAVYCITRGHNKHEENYRSMRKIESYLKVFFHESNADEYIWKNKRVFSYEDMMKAKHSIILTYEDIEKAAKERSEE